MPNIEDMYDDNQTYCPPVSRWEVFKNIFRHSSGRLIKVSLLTFLFALPLFIWIIISTLALNSLAINYAGAEEIIRQQLLIKIFWTKVTMCAVSIPLSILFSIGLAGAHYVMRQLVWDKGFILMNAYKKGIKDNAKHFLLSTLLFSTLIAVCYIGYNYVAINPMAIGWLKVLSIIVLILLAVLIMVVEILVYTQLVIYELPLSKIIRNAVIFALVLAPSNIGIMLITIFPVLIIFIIPHILSPIIGGAILAIVGFGYIILVTTLYSHSIYDRYINKENHPQIFEKGLISKDEK